MIKEIACASLTAAALLVPACAASAAPAPAPAPSGGAPAAPLLDGVLGSLEIGHPATFLQSLLPRGVLGR